MNTLGMPVKFETVEHFELQAGESGIIGFAANDRTRVDRATDTHFAVDDIERRFETL